MNVVIVKNTSSSFQFLFTLPIYLFLFCFWSIFELLLQTNEEKREEKIWETINKKLSFLKSKNILS